MKRDNDSDATALAEARAFIENWRERGKRDGERSLPSTDDEVTQSLAKGSAKTPMTATCASDHRHDLELLAQGSIPRPEGLGRVAGSELRNAAERCRTTNAELEHFHQKHEAGLKGREPRTRPSPWKRFSGQDLYVMLLGFIMAVESIATDMVAHSRCGIRCRKHDGREAQRQHRRPSPSIPSLSSRLNSRQNPNRSPSRSRVSNRSLPSKSSRTPH